MIGLKAPEVEYGSDGGRGLVCVEAPRDHREAGATSQPEAMLGGDTWTVPVLGGEPTRMLAKAEALTFIESATGPPRVLFSEHDEAAFDVALDELSIGADEKAAVEIICPVGRGSFWLGLSIV